jgi:crotonobetainyl-CoA:carnitine CoA-transferase CaiB-like acyl-CoA transferase
MTDGMMTFMTSHAAEWLFARREPAGGEYFNTGGAAAYNVYRGADGRWFTLGIIERHFWERLRDLVARPDLPDDPLVGGAEGERARAILTEVFRARPAAEWVALLRENDLPVGPISTLQEAFSDPQIRSRDMLQWMNHPVEGRIPQIGFPVKFSDTPGEMRRPPPMLGEHTDEVLSELGYDEGDIAELRSSQAI